MKEWNSEELMEKNPILQDISQGKEAVWVNPDYVPFQEAAKGAELTMEDVLDADRRLRRFAPFISKCFPETRKRGGLIESDLTAIPAMQEHIRGSFSSRKTAIWPSQAPLRPEGEFTRC